LKDPVNEGDLVAGRYRLLRPIGSGGMGTVWAARHELLGRNFAIKIATLPDRAGPEHRARFLREARIVGQLRHPNVVDVADVGDAGADAGLYLAMELLEGQSLAERIATHGSLSPPEALAIISEICRGLEAAHKAGVVHRDIKPENIFLARGATGGVVPKLLDFGVSKGGTEGETLATLTGQLYGTPAYMSPEQALGETDIDQRTDIWSLGVVLYEMLTATRPFAADSYPALLPLIAEAAPTPLPPTIPHDVRAIVARCLAKSKDERYPSADALRRALDTARAATEDPDNRLIERTRVLPSFRPVPGDPSPSSLRRTIVLSALAFTVAAGAALYRLRTAGSATDATATADAAPITSAAPLASAAPTTNAAPLASATPTTSAAPLANAAPTTSATSTKAASPIASATPRVHTSVTTHATTKPSTTSPPSSTKPVTRVDSAGF